MPSQRLNHKAARNALCTAMAAALVAGCASSGPVTMRTASEPNAKMDRAAAKDIARAESAVAKQPQDAAARVELANAYLLAGRFESAVTTFEDAQYLGDSTGRTALSLALAKIATGNSAGAVENLDQSSETLAQSDYGLALALAGETKRGVDVLANALRGGENTAKVRQNLAYAYALDGRWADAQLMAAQDVPADQLNARIAEWARQGKPEDFRVRVASMLGAPVMADSGQPVQFALARPASAAPALAAASQSDSELPPVNNDNNFWVTEAARPDPEPVSPEVPSSQREFAAAAPVPASSAQPARPFDKAFAQSGDDRVFVARPVVQSVPQRVAYAEEAQRKSRPVARSRNLVPAVKEAMSGTATGSHLVQLGSFSSRQNAERAWSIYLSRNPELQKFDKTVSQAMVGGKKYWRVSAGGFDKAATASKMCSTVKHRGGACIAWTQGNPLPGAIAKN